MTARAVYFQIIGGASGDMLLSALFGLGADFGNLERSFQQKGHHLKLTFSRIPVGGIHGWQLQVSESSPSRWHWEDLDEWLSAVPLSPSGRSRALTALQLLRDAEATAHGVSPDQVHFHELGNIDTLLDVLGYFYALEQLGIQEVYFSGIPAGKGILKGEHGEIPNPPPAVTALMQGICVEWRDESTELVTPTALALFKTSGSQNAPSLTVVGSSCAFGQRASLRDSYLRAFLGTVETGGECLVLIETNVDDITPEQCAFTINELLKVGARDATMTPVVMKKGRPGWVVSVLTDAQTEEAAVEVLLRETGVLGYRRQEVHRIALPRKTIEVETRFGKIRVKIGFRGSHPVSLKPEYEDCAAAAMRSGVSLHQVADAARTAARKAIYEN
ncbi:MAG: nickel pincer cofactor biosynthesis protein LarC [bacterium JZ-2024 1]